MINEINFPTIAGGFLNNIVIKDRIPKQVFKGRIRTSKRDGHKKKLSSEVVVDHENNLTLRHGIQGTGCTASFLWSTYTTLDTSYYW